MEMANETRLAKFLREARLAAGKSQVEVGRELGYTSQFVANWERGVSKPPPDCLYKYAEFLDLSPPLWINVMMKDYQETLQGYFYKQRKKK